MSQGIETSQENVWIKTPEYNFLDMKYSRFVKLSALVWEYEKVQKMTDALITPNDKADILTRYKNAFQETAKNGINVSFQSELDTILQSDIVPTSQKNWLRKSLQSALLDFAQDSGIRKFEAQLVMDNYGVYTISPDRTINQTDTFISVNFRDTPNRDKMTLNVEYKKQSDTIAALQQKVASLEGGQEALINQTQGTNRIRNTSRESQAKVVLPTKEWQKNLLSVQDSKNLAELIKNCDLKDSCFNSNILDVTSLQQKIVDYKPTDYAGRNWDDGLLGPATFSAAKDYISSKKTA